MKIALIPIDNRPVCYNLPKEIAEIDRDLELVLPDKRYLGGLTSYADIDAIFHWLDKLENIDAIVVSLDTIAYGGLISSRRSKQSYEEIKERMEKFREKLNLYNGKVYAFSSIMRISNNNINEEEKEYWDKYGTQIFEYSYNFHKDGIDSSEVPPEILNDYLATRRRNFRINKMYAQWFEQGLFAALVFSKDDCAQYGFNVMEAEILDGMVRKNKNALVKTGADEIPLSLFAHAVCDYNKAAPKISVKFLAPVHTDLISKYEDISIAKCVRSQIELSGGVNIYSDNEQEDLALIVNNFEDYQGEIVMGIKTQPFSGQFSLPKKPYMLADVRFANGADNIFIEKLFKKPINFDNFYGYSGWNTSANTLGSLLCAGIVRHLAKNYNADAFKKLQMVRFLDDWAYQANVRQALKKAKGKEPRPDFRKLEKLMSPFEKRLKKLFGLKAHVNYKFPWKRFFEIEAVIR